MVKVEVVNSVFDKFCNNNFVELYVFNKMVLDVENNVSHNRLESWPDNFIEHRLEASDNQEPNRKGYGVNNRLQRLIDREKGLRDSRSCRAQPQAGTV